MGQTARHDTGEPTKARRTLSNPVAAGLKFCTILSRFALKLAITMSSSTSAGEILTIKQVADYLKVTERTIYRLAAAKKIPAFKVGGTWRFSRADIDRWIKQQSMEGLATRGDGDDTAIGQANDGERK
jgi:excisionase family DNA binding protein